MRMLWRQYSCAVMAVVQGTCVGGGFGMAACADVVIADDSARFGLPEPRHGFIPSQILPFLVRRLGEAPVRRIAVTAAVIDASEAQRLGYVLDVVPSEELFATAMSLAQQIAVGSPRSLREIKSLVHQGLTASVGEHMERHTESLAAC